jgi:hypothetical protein
VEASDASYEVMIELIPEQGGEQFLVSGAFDDVLSAIEKRAERLFAFAASEKARQDKDKTDTSPLPVFAKLEPIYEESSRQASPSQQRERAATAEKRKKIAPVYFWSMFGIASTLAAGWGALEITVHQRYKTLKKGDGDLAYWNRSKSLQITARALFVAAATGVTATFVMLFFTDFTSGKTDDQAVTWLPMPLFGGGALVMESRF